MLQTELFVAFGTITDSARAAQFYGETLGLPLHYEDEVALVFDANGVELRLQKVPSVTLSGFTVLGWQVRDITTVVAALVARGVTTERYSRLVQDARGVWQAPSGARVVWFKDPDGNLLSVAEYGRHSG